MAGATQDDSFALVLGGLLGLVGAAALVAARSGDSGWSRRVAWRERGGAPALPAGQSRRDGAVPARTTPQDQHAEAQTRAARLLHGGCAILSLAVLADSGIEHYRARYRNPAMVIPPLASSLTLAASLHGATDRSHGPGSRRDAVYGIAALAGVVGTGFHVYNVGKRVGGFSLSNLFFGAPLGAPMALFLAGALGHAAEDVRRGAARPGRDARLLGVPAGRALAAITSAGLLGTVGEAGLLHFRGAFHNPAMLLPVTLPPVAAGLMAAAAVDPRPARRRPVTRAWLWLTAALGGVGMGFHAYGVSRNMGGWRAWSQSLLNGPPVPAPPSFTGLALAGLAALDLAERGGHG